MGDTHWLRRDRPDVAVRNSTVPRRSVRDTGFRDSSRTYEITRGMTVVVRLFFESSGSKEMQRMSGARVGGLRYITSLGVRPIAEDISALGGKLLTPPLMLQRSGIEDRGCLRTGKSLETTFRALIVIASNS
jgi:hypothetical protein